MTAYQRQNGKKVFILLLTQICRGGRGGGSKIFTEFFLSVLVCRRAHGEQEMLTETSIL